MRNPRTCFEAEVPQRTLVQLDAHGHTISAQAEVTLGASISNIQLAETTVA